MKHALPLALLIAAMPAAAAEQCVWPFRTSPAEIAARMKADLGETLITACPAKTRIEVRFLLPTGKTPRKIDVAAKGCKAAEPAIARWLKARSTDDFMPYDKPQDVAFKIALRFSA